MQISINESDWKLFRQKLPDWQEAYIDKLNREYASLLTGTGTASDKFWELEKRISSDKHRMGIDARMSRSNMYTNLLGLLQDGVITLDDLVDFSIDLQERMTFLMQNGQN